MHRKNLKITLAGLVEELVEQGLTLEQASKEFERQFLIASIRHHDGSLGRSARSLGVHRNTLRNKLGNLGITARDYAPKASKTPRQSSGN